MEKDPRLFQNDLSPEEQAKQDALWSKGQEQKEKATKRLEIIDAVADIIDSIL